MKLNFRFAIILAFFAFAVCSCKKDDSCDDTLSLSTKTLNFTQEASSQNVTVTTNVKEWTATCDSSWITVVLANDGKSFLVQVTENVAPGGEAADARSANVFVHAGALLDSVKVIQGEESKVFDVNAYDKLDIYPAEGGEVSVKVSYNSSYTVSGTTDWLKQEEEEATKGALDDTLTFIISDNTTVNPRSAKLKFTSSKGDVKEVEISQKRMSKYTIMLYGSSGGGDDLDWDVVSQLYSVMNGGCSDTVRMVMQYNFMPVSQKYSNLKGTKRMVISTSYLTEDDVNFSGCTTESDSTAKMVDAAIADGGMHIAKTVSQTPIRLDNPANMADFINWTVENQPAEKYILIITGHGGGWNPKDDADKTFATKASAWDDNFKVGETEYAITARDLVNGIKQSNYESKIQLIIQDACEMNYIENVAEYSTTSVPRALLPFQSVTAMPLENLLSELKVGTSLDEAVNACGQAITISDLTYWDLTKVPDLLTSIASAVPDFIGDYEENEDDYNDWINGLNAVSNTSGDYYQFWKELPDNTESTDLSDKAVAVKNKFDAAATKTWYATKSKYKSNIKASVLLYNKTTYDDLSEKALQSFQLSHFYQVTKWDGLFKVATFSNGEE